MKNLAAILLVLSLGFLAGCVNEETSKADGENLMPSVEQLQEELAAANAEIEQLKQQISSLKAENIEIQDLALKTVMTMLEKQIAHDKKIQDNLKQKVDKLEVANKDLQLKLKQSQSESQTDKQVSMVVD